MLAAETAPSALACRSLKDHKDLCSLSGVQIPMHHSCSTENSRIQQGSGKSRNTSSTLSLIRLLTVSAVSVSGILQRQLAPCNAKRSSDQRHGSGNCRTLGKIVAWSSRSALPGVSVLFRSASAAMVSNAASTITDGFRSRWIAAFIVPEFAST
jgi:hypothetical protein